MKKLLLLLLTMFFILSGCSNKDNSIKSDELVVVDGKYPTVWDETLQYKDINEFDQDIAKLLEYCDVFKQYEGKLHTADGLYGYISTLYGKEFNGIYDKLSSYVTFGSNLYSSDNKYYECSLKLDEARNMIDASKAFFDEEFTSLPLKTRIDLFKDERLTEYEFLYSSYLVEDVNLLSEETLDIYSKATISQGRMNRIFSNLVNYEIPSVTYTVKGETLEINDSNLVDIMSRDYDNKTKTEIYNAWWKNVAQYKNTLASLLETQLLEQYSYAQVVGYLDTKTMANDNMGFYYDVIQTIIDYAHLYTDKHIEYYSLYADKETGTYFTSDKYKSLSSYKEEYINYDDGVDEVIDALSILGDDYQSKLVGMFNSGHIDAYPKDNKYSGAFEIGNYTNQYPFVNFNYTGTTEDVADIAHEMGHACYDILSNDNQELYNWVTVTFTQEVASITNELLYYSYKIKNAKNNDEKIFYLEKYLNRFTSDMFNACFWQEFEIYCHQLVENGGYLDVEDLCNKWSELSKQYYGESLNQGDYGQYRWATLSSLYNNYYEYTYATSVCYATVLSQAIINNEPGAVDNYLSFLKAGGSLAPVDALYIAGINIYDSEVYTKALDHFCEMVEELSILVKN